MAKNKLDLVEDAVVNNSKSIDTVLWTFFVLEFAFVYLKLTKKEVFSWGGVEVVTTEGWRVIFFALLTVAHWYTTWRLLQSVKRFLEMSGSEERERAFLRVTSSGGLFTRGMLPRTMGKWNINWIKGLDLTRFPSYLAALGIVAAIVPFHPHGCTTLITYWSVALLIMIINWLIGSKWAVTLSGLTNTVNAVGSIAGLKPPASL